MSIDRAKMDLMQLDQREARLKLELVDIAAKKEKIAHYIEMAVTYGAIEAGDVQAIRQTSTPGGRPRGGRGDMIVGVVTDMLKQRGKPLQTVALLDELSDRGVVVGGEKPRNNLSGILSRADHLVNDRSRGWGLAEWNAPTSPEPITSATASPLPFAQSPTVDPE